MRSLNTLKDDLRAKLNKYLRKYDNVFFIVLKLFVYSATRMFSILLPANGKNSVRKLPSELLRIAVCMDGGLGDNLVYAMWVKEFSKIVEGNFILDVFVHKSKNYSLSIFREDSFVKNVYSKDLFESNFSKYDLAFAFRRFPQVVYYKPDRVKQFSPNLIELIDKYKKFRKDYDKFFVYGALADTQVDLYSICRGEKRIQQPDIDNLLGITEQTKYFLHINDEALDILKDYNLADKKYVTIARSVDLAQKHAANVRLWPLEYYEKLIRDIKERYPEIKIVQLGVDRCESINGVDIDLLGKTNLEQVKAILKYSLLHIDGECGMVHMKHFLGGKSAVFFGQTAVEYLGYDNNINLKSDGCPHWCEWIVDDWQTHCIRGYDVPPCMTELKPEYAFEKISKYLDTVYNKPDKNIKVQEVENVRVFLDGFDDKSLNIMFYGSEFYEVAKEYAGLHNIVVYDSKLKNKDINEAKTLGIELEYGDIYNIPDNDNTFDVVLVPKENSFDRDFILAELKRVSREYVVYEGRNA